MYEPQIIQSPASSHSPNGASIVATKTTISARSSGTRPATADCTNSPFLNALGVRSTIGDSSANGISAPKTLASRRMLCSMSWSSGFRGLLPSASSIAGATAAIACRATSKVGIPATSKPIRMPASASASCRTPAPIWCVAPVASLRRPSSGATNPPAPAFQPTRGIPAASSARNFAICARIPDSTSGSIGVSFYSGVGD